MLLCLGWDPEPVGCPISVFPALVVGFRPKIFLFMPLSVACERRARNEAAVVIVC